MAELGRVLVGRAFVLGIWLSFWFHSKKGEICMGK